MTSIVTFFIREALRFLAINHLILLIPLFPFLPVQVNAQEKTVTYYADPAALPPDLPVAITHLTAHIAFQPDKNLVEGTAEFTFVPNRYRVDSILFHAPGFTVSAVKIDNRPVEYHHTGNNLVIDPGKEFKDLSPVTRHASHLIITYTAAPLSGAIYFIGWRPEEAGKRKQIWAHRPHGWIPYMDGRITVDMFITFDGRYNVFSNGERLQIAENADGSKTWHYSMKKDHPFFSTALVIGDYKYKQTKTARGVPLEFWYYSDMPDRLATTYIHTEKMFDFLEKELGYNYPYPLYREAPVIDYMYGAMETTTSTIFGDYMQIGPRAWWQRNYVNVNVHELTHQWFGNCVAHLINRDVWLTESFATYYAKLFEKNIYGEDYWQNLRNDEMTLTFEAAAKNSYPVGGSQGGVQRIYQKGSLALEMLRNVMGDDEFRDAVRRYLEKYAFGYAETNDFKRCVYEASGKPYDWFFDQWILRGGEPEYLVSDTVLSDSPGMQYTVFRIRQVQEVNELQGLFRMPFSFEVNYADGTKSLATEWIEKQYTEVRIPNPDKKTIGFLLFDPGRKVLRKTVFSQPFNRLMAQAQHAEKMIDRYDAWRALRNEPVDRKSEVLVREFQDESFWLIRTEILQQLAPANSPESMEILRQALHDRDANVRKAALLLLKPVPDLLRDVVEALLFDSSYLNVEYALLTLCASFPENTDYYLELTRDMEGWRGRNIRMAWLSVAIRSGREEYMEELITYCSPEYEFETRMNAFRLLGILNYHDKETDQYAGQAAAHWNNKLSAVAGEYLKVNR